MEGDEARAPTDTLTEVLLTLFLRVRLRDRLNCGCLRTPLSLFNRNELPVPRVSATFVNHVQLLLMAYRHAGDTINASSGRYFRKGSGRGM